MTAHAAITTWRQPSEKSNRPARNRTVTPLKRNIVVGLPDAKPKSATASERTRKANFCFRKNFMTLLEATSHLIDCAKTNAHESDRVMQRAVKRMEKRLAVLKLRAAKTLRRNRRLAWGIYTSYLKHN